MRTPVIDAISIKIDNRSISVSVLMTRVLYIALATEQTCIGWHFYAVVTHHQTDSIAMLAWLHNAHEGMVSKVATIGS